MTDCNSFPEDLCFNCGEEFERVGLYKGGLCLQCWECYVCKYCEGYAGYCISKCNGCGDLMCTECAKINLSYLNVVCSSCVKYIVTTCKSCAQDLPYANFLNETKNNQWNLTLEKERDCQDCVKRKPVVVELTKELLGPNVWQIVFQYLFSE